MFGVHTPLSAIPGIGPRFAARFKRLGIETVRDLLYHFPSRYEDFSRISPIADLEPGELATIHGVVRDVELRRTWRKHMTIVQAVIEDDSGTIVATWFNQPYVKEALREGTHANFSGKVSVSDGELSLAHPTYEIVRDRGNESGERRSAERPRESASAVGTVHTARLVPVYPETYGLTSKGIRYCLQPLLAALPRLEEWIPSQVLREGLARTNADLTRTGTESMPEINRALRDIHFPDAIEDALAARRRFEFENLFLLQLVNGEEKLKLRKKRAPAIPADIEMLKKTIAALPFPLTFSQKKSLWEILQDMEKPLPMNRLLQGDVGSGKTVIAALAALAAARAGFQTAVLAPTEILARQHYATFKKLFRSIPGNEQPATALLTAGEAKMLHEDDLEETVGKAALASRIKSGSAGVVIGTHALISSRGGQASVAFADLGLVIVDEQHRFGVEQRAALARANHSSGGAVPHFLSMSATPIPRTLMLTVFGDLDISTITEMPLGRKRIVTKAVAPEHRAKAYQFIRQEIKKGRQAFVICPRIAPAQEEDRKENARPPAGGWNAAVTEVKTVTEEYEKLSQKVFPDLRIAMLHGQMKGQEKERIMADFRDRNTDILVSTSVVEVGVDVPNAAIMMIEGSERFGLAQLYQFRGRVGRGEHQSYCFLFTETSGASAQARLKAIVSAKNGFELAERDLRLRGPGQFIGGKQSGIPDFAMRALEDTALVKSGAEAARGILEADPSLSRHPALRERLDEFRKKLHAE